MLNKYLDILWRVFLISLISCFLSCTVGTPELNPKQEREIASRVRSKVDSFSRAQWNICWTTAALAAQPKVDSIIASFDARIPTDSLKTPTKPTKPEKPSLDIPIFEEKVGPNGASKTKN